MTPLRDGMNLVAKEYVASQPADDPGVLVLSCFAGAARELGEAVIVNPFDIEGMAEAILQGLNMPLGERKERWTAMMEVLERNDITAWRESFVRALSATDRAAVSSRRPPQPATLARRRYRRDARPLRLGFAGRRVLHSRTLGRRGLPDDRGRARRLSGRARPLADAPAGSDRDRLADHRRPRRDDQSSLDLFDPGR